MERMTRGGLVAAMLTAAMTSLPGTAAGAAPPGGADPAAAAALSGASSSAQRALAPGAAADKPLWRQSRDYWTTLAAPRVAADAGDGKPGARARPDWFQAAVARHHTGFPPAARELARREAIANRTGRSPRAVARRSGAAAVQQSRLLTLLAEFNPNANDDFSGWERPDDPSAPTGCVTEPPGTTISGPVHNELPDPATNGTGRDNNTFWVPDFSREHFDRLIYSEQGLTQPVRTDLAGGVEPAPPHGPQLLPRDVQGRIRAHRNGDARGSSSRTRRRGTRPTAARPALRATPGIRTTRAARPRWRSTRPRRSRLRSPTSPGPISTSRTRATRTTTATSSSPMACSTTSSSSMPGRTRRTTAARRRATRSGRAPRRSIPPMAGTRSPAPASRC